MSEPNHDDPALPVAMEGPEAPQTLPLPTDPALLGPPAAPSELTSPQTLPLVTGSAVAAPLEDRAEPAPPTEAAPPPQSATEPEAPSAASRGSEAAASPPPRARPPRVIDMRRPRPAPVEQPRARPWPVEAERQRRPRPLGPPRERAQRRDVPGAESPTREVPVATGEREGAFSASEAELAAEPQAIARPEARPASPPAAAHEEPPLPIAAAAVATDVPLWVPSATRSVHRKKKPQRTAKEALGAKAHARALAKPPRPEPQRPASRTMAEDDLEPQSNPKATQQTVTPSDEDEAAPLPKQGFFQRVFGRFFRS